MTRNYQIPKDPKEEKIRKVVFITTGIIAGVLILNLFTGIFSYVYGFARCGKQPVAASRFMAGYHYYIPGENGYSVNAFMEYYCSVEEAEEAGFHSFN